VINGMCHNTEINFLLKCEIFQCRRRITSIIFCIKLRAQSAALSQKFRNRYYKQKYKAIGMEEEQTRVMFLMKI
jgi:hypothetical protein